MLFALSLLSINAFAGSVTVVGSPTQIEVTDRLFFKINGGFPENPNGCPSSFRYEFVMEDGSSGNNKNMALSVLLSAHALNQNLKFTIFSNKCSDINYPAVIGVGFE